jgi:hypothetical protein
MTQATNLIASAADSADAIIAARRFRNVLTGILLVILIAQLTVFLVYRFRGPFAAAGADHPFWLDFAQYATGTLVFIATVTSILLSVTLLLLTLVLLVGRLLGVGGATQAFLWSVLLAMLLFPWQALLWFPGVAGTEFRIPGALYTWSELVRSARFGLDSEVDVWNGLLKWARFVVFPLVAMILLGFVHLRSRRALRQALNPVG